MKNKLKGVIQSNTNSQKNFKLNHDIEEVSYFFIDKFILEETDKKYA